jgi:hypothetical protein
MDSASRTSTLARAQQSLLEALTYWLYGSNRSMSQRANWRKHRLVSAAPLERAAIALVDAGIAISRPIIRTGGEITARDYAGALAAFYAAWEEHIPSEDGGAEAASLPAATLYRDWLASGGGKARYWPVRELKRLLASDRYAGLFHRVLLHGSLATLDDTDGFSDFDLAFVVKRRVLIRADSLLRLRAFARKALTLTYAFDPFMHHGPYYIPEMDLRWYPDAHFPCVLFKYGVDMVEPERSLDVRTRISENLTHEQFSIFANFFRNRATERHVPDNGFDLEWLLGSAMILPALYLQGMTGEHRYKRDTFSLAERDFSHEEWEPIRTATNLRERLGPRPKPSRALASLAMGIGWPGLLQRRAIQADARSSRLHDAAEILGPDFPHRVLRLIAVMKSRLQDNGMVGASTAADGEGLGSLCRNAVVSLSSNDLCEPPLALDRAFYRKVTEQLVAKWTELPVRPTAIYQIGQVGAPGISDLDFIVVYPDDSIVDWPMFEPRAFPETIRQVFTHPPYLCAESAWNSMPGWFPVFDVEHLWGRRLPSPELSPVAESGVALGSLVDYLLVKIPRDLFWLSAQPKLRVRTILCMLHSLKYSFALAKRAGIPTPTSSREFVERVDDARRDWLGWKGSPRDLLLSLLGEAIQLSAELTGLVHTTLSPRIRQAPLNRAATPPTSGLFPYFDPAWTRTGSVRSAIDSWVRTGAPKWQAPTTLQFVLSSYAAGSQDFGEYLESHGCVTGLDWDSTGWDAGLEYHAEAMVTYALGAHRLGVPAQKYVALGFSPKLGESERRPRGGSDRPFGSLASRAWRAMRKP